VWAPPRRNVVTLSVGPGAAAALAAFALVAGCAGGGGAEAVRRAAAPSTPTTEPTSSTGSPAASAVPPPGPVPSAPAEKVHALTGPPDVRLRYAGGTVEVAPYSWCYSSGCADGFPQHSPHVGSPTEVFVDFPLPDWRFTATLIPAGGRCGPYLPAPMERLGPGSFVIRPAGHAGDYRVELFGRGNVDLGAEFLWTTPVDGPLPPPRARLALLAGHDGQLDSYGVELDVRNLAGTPRRVSARITATAANGRSLTFTPTRSGGCHADGTLYFDGPDPSGDEAAALGPAPYTYRVALRLDGRRHVAVAHWPADVIRGNAPSVRLRFEPALPPMR
jgi:hypothetical protein